MTVRIGIIGIGNQGAMYSIVLNKHRLGEQEIPPLKGAALVAVSDPSPTQRKWASENLPGVAVFDTAEDLFDGGMVDAVIVATPHYFHPDLAIQAIKRGIHVLVDKPAGVSVKHVREMNKASLEHPEVVFGMMFNQRTNPLYKKIKDVIDSGAIGEIRRFNWLITDWWRPQAYYDMSAWRATWAGEGGGVLINQAPHQIDLLQWLCGMPKSVFAKAKYGGYRDISVDDDVTAILEYENGATGVFSTCTHDLVGTDRFEIHGGSGKLVVENSSNLKMTLTRPEAEVNENATLEQVQALLSGTGSDLEFIKEETELNLGNEWGFQHIEVIENFIDGIQNGTKLLAEGVEGIRALEITNAMHLSSWTGQEVALPVDDAVFQDMLQTKINEELR